MEWKIRPIFDSVFYIIENRHQLTIQRNKTKILTETESILLDYFKVEPIAWFTHEVNSHWKPRPRLKNLDLYFDFIKFIKFHS